jgi:stress-induced-phosphoprotein 1
MADQAKAKGNAAFSAGKFEDAIKHFGDAIALAPDNHVLFSNRSAAYASLHKYQDALRDAKKTVELKPEWPKGYSRLGAAYVGLQDFDKAISAYKKGLQTDPNNDGLKSGLADAEAAKPRARAPPSGDSPMGGSSPFGNMFGPDVWVKLQGDPRTRPYLQQPDFVAMINDAQKNPNNLSRYTNDPRMLQVVAVLLGVNLQTAKPGAEFEGEGGHDTVASSNPEIRMDERPRSATSTQAAPATAPEPEPEPMEVNDDEKEKKMRKTEAVKEKECGNAEYKKKNFEAAVSHYSKAIELDGEDISFITNRAAVYLEMGKYEECIADCELAVETGRSLHADYKLIAKALTRKGTALVKMAKTSKDYDAAIEVFNKALTEHRNPDTLKKLNEAERTKKELEQQEYYDPAMADQEREKGNEYFKKDQYPEAVKHYTEAIKRNPSDAKAYSNRAACYTKLGALPEGLKDANKCIELDEKFVKGYSRKGAIQFFMKEYDKALETYQLGLKHNEGNQELMDGVRRCVDQINKMNRGDISADDLKEKQARAMSDPEIQGILSDPVMRQVLTDFQENPKAAQEHMKNPTVMGKIQKLVSAGIVQVR